VTENHLKEKYLKDFKAIQRLVNQFDPCALIKGGAPADEYDFLTNLILSKYYSHTARQEIKSSIIKELKRRFDISGWDELESHDKGRFFDELDSLLDKVENYYR
jgi:hypothetical protein